MALSWHSPHADLTPTSDGWEWRCSCGALVREQGDDSRRVHILTHGAGEARTTISYQDEEAWWPRFDAAMAARNFDNPPPHPFDAWIERVHEYERPGAGN